MKIGQIEEAIACGDMSAPMVFTKMQEHIDALRRQLAEAEAIAENPVPYWSQRIDWYRNGEWRANARAEAAEAKRALAEQLLREVLNTIESTPEGIALDSRIVAYLADAAIAAGEGKS